MTTAVAAGDVLFQRGVNDGDTSMWDDTALVKAYDQAISMIKMTVNDPHQSVNCDKKQKHHKKSKRHKKGKIVQETVQNWQVGDLCWATYSEDGYQYRATITSIDPVKRTCIVKYRSYGNAEEQCLGDILPLNKMRDVSETESDLPSEIDCSDAQQSCVSSAPSSASVCSRSSNKESGHGDHLKMPHGIKHENGPMPSSKRASGLPDSTVPPFAFPFPLNGIPPVFPGAFGAVPSSSAFPPPPVVPAIPPPILPDLGSITDDKDALYGMLISWYMSGYHTGYYQCLKQMQKAQKSDVESSTMTNNSTSARGTSRTAKETL